MIAASADGVPIAYNVLGARPQLVLLHGFTEAAESRQERGYVDRFLRGRRQVLLIDCRGHGGSGKPHEVAAYGGDKRARDVVAVLDALGIGAADLVGFSMGGLIALACVAHGRSDMWAALAALQASLLAIAGTRDPTFAGVRAFVERVDGRFLALEGRNHVTIFLAAGGIVTAIERFLEDQAAAATIAPANAE